jgi:hypothetical protein
MSNNLERIQNWYESNCNGDWEHSYGIKIENLDNPGWMVTLDLEDTFLEEVGFEPIEYQKDEENDWIHCKKSEQKFKAVGGPQKLDELLEVFLNWAESHAPENDS